MKLKIKAPAQNNNNMRHQQLWKKHHKQPETLCGCSLYQRAEWELKESMQ